MNEEIRRQSKLLQQILVRMDRPGPQVHPHQASQAPVLPPINRHNLEVSSMAPMIGEPVFERFRKHKAPTFYVISDPSLVKDRMKKIQQIFNYMHLTNAEKVAYTVHHLEREA